MIANIKRKRFKISQIAFFNVARPCGYHQCRCINRYCYFLSVFYNEWYRMRSIDRISWFSLQYFPPPSKKAEYKDVMQLTNNYVLVSKIVRLSLVNNPLLRFLSVHWSKMRIFPRTMTTNFIFTSCNTYFFHLRLMK